MSAPFPCPKCGRSLAPSGEVEADGCTVPVYQCDECIVLGDVLGKPFEVALTFCVGADGRAFDPASPGKPPWES